LPSLIRKFSLEQEGGKGMARVEERGMVVGKVGVEEGDKHNRMILRTLL